MNCPPTELCVAAITANPQSLYLRTPAHSILHGIMAKGSSPNQIMRDCFLALLFAGLLTASAVSQQPSAKSSGSAPAKTTSPQDQSKPDEKTPVGGAAAKIADLATPNAKAPDYTQESFVIEQMHSHYRFEATALDAKKPPPASACKAKPGSSSGDNSGGLQLRQRARRNPLRTRAERRWHGRQGGSRCRTGSQRSHRARSSRYTDYRQKHITVPGLRPGEVLEYNMVTIIHTPLAPRQFWAEYEFDKGNITLDETLEVDVPSGRSLKLKGKPGIEPKITEENGRRIYHWSGSHLEREDDTKDKEKEKDKKKKKAVPMTKARHSVDDIRKLGRDRPVVRRTREGSSQAHARNSRQGARTDQGHEHGSGKEQRLFTTTLRRISVT